MPILHVLAGPNGSGKSTYAERVLGPATSLPFITADYIAQTLWPNEATTHAYDAAAMAASIRQTYLSGGTSFITETVFSHPSKLEFLMAARSAGFLIHLHIVMVPLEVTVDRVRERVQRGGHDVPLDKIQGRYSRLWPLIREARDIADRTDFFDNSLARTPFRRIVAFERGRQIGRVQWPTWTHPALLTD